MVVTRPKTPPRSSLSPRPVFQLPPFRTKTIGLSRYVFTSRTTGRFLACNPTAVFTPCLLAKAANSSASETFRASGPKQSVKSAILSYTNVNPSGCVEAKLISHKPRAEQASCPDITYIPRKHPSWHSESKSSALYAEEASQTPQPCQLPDHWLCLQRCGMHAQLRSCAFELQLRLSYAKR